MLYRQAIELARKWLPKEMFRRLKVLKNYPKRKKLRKLAPIITRLLYEALEELGIEYFYDYGSLLGIIREGHFLYHDIEIDIGVFLDDAKEGFALLRHELEKYGFNLNITYSVNEETVECQYDYKCIGVDFFLYKREGTRVYNYAIMSGLLKDNDGTMYLPSIKRYYSDISECEYIPIYGVPLRVPKNYETLLKEKYADWHIPDYNWQSSFEDMPAAQFTEKAMCYFIE